MSKRAELAQAIARRARTEAEKGKSMLRAEVTNSNPLTVELMTSGVSISDDELTLTQWVRFYDETHGIEDGDTVLLHHESGTWLVTDVISDTPIQTGA